MGGEGLEMLNQREENINCVKEELIDIILSPNIQNKELLAASSKN